MYLWKTKALAERLKNDSLSQKDHFWYLLLFVTINSVIIELSVYDIQPVTIIYITQSLLMVSITIIGTWLCYRTNRNGDNKDFITRYICLWIPIAIRIALLGFSVLMVYVPMGILLIGSEYLESDTWLDSLFIVVLAALFYWRLYAAIRLISQSVKSKPVGQPESEFFCNERK